MLLIYFPLYSSLSARHSFLTAGDDCLALLSRCQDLSVHFERRAKSNACSARPNACLCAWNATLGCASGELPEPRSCVQVDKLPLHNPSGWRCLGSRSFVCRACLVNFRSSSSPLYFLVPTQQ